MVNNSSNHSHLIRLLTVGNKMFGSFFRWFQWNHSHLMMRCRWKEPHAGRRAFTNEDLNVSGSDFR